tara:strand:+ start:721 stop:900 length:180 start_codon:yes stop_codon:yes gene_type:complete
MKYLTGKDYPDLCFNCQKAVDMGMHLISMGFADDYIEDNEGPSMIAYDKGWLCNDACDT